MLEILKTEGYSIAFSVVLGIGILAAIKPRCAQGSCTIKKAPNPDEVTHSTYQIGSKCYKFNTQSIQCPLNGTIESFQIEQQEG
jgi:hypothetical protein